MQAFIFAAGLGTRLKPLTDNMPKALVPVGGKTLIDRVIAGLKKQGVTDYIVNVHHFAEQLISHLEGYDNELTISISDERTLLCNTGGAIKHASNLIKKDAPFLVHNVDIISNFRVADMLKKHQNALATLLVSQRETSRYLLFNNDLRLVGWTNIATGEVKSPFSGLDISKCRKLAFAGIHILNPKVSELMEPYPESFSIIDFYLDMAAEHPIYGYIQEDLQMIDVGKIPALKQAEELINTLNI